jgi:hypothetical protein
LDFEQKVKGKTSREVKWLLGSPDETSDGGTGTTTYWRYYGRTTNPVNGKTDWYVELRSHYDEPTGTWRVTYVDYTHPKPPRGD